MSNKKFLYISIEVSENKTVEQIIKDVVDEIESCNWQVVAYDLNPHKLDENIYLMTVYAEKRGNDGGRDRR